MFTKAAFITLKYSENSNTVNFKQLFSILINVKMQFVSKMRI